ncbi:hypothetical protein ETAA8_65170 [Anatilimnocola aggregata]|uniref:Uncharacterized protein n=2 Tax=Anatilimnocola aggregata TaxID=2528021 RepID=A0A517YMC4_9BACT|nr:hypothetical protein ETAA8_65170 [Anatilimnocola aggregata]
MRSGAVNGSQQPCLSNALRQPHVGQGKARDLKQQRNQSQQRDEAVKATTEGQDLLLQVNVVWLAAGNVTTGAALGASQPRAVDRGTPRRTAASMLLVLQTISRRR